MVKYYKIKIYEKKGKVNIALLLMFLLVSFSYIYSYYEVGK